MSDEPRAHYGTRVCLQCTKQFNDQHTHQKHMRTHGTLYECPFPGCTHKCYVKEHYDAAEPAQHTYPCDANGCTDSFNDVSSLIKHRVRKHPHIQRPVDVVKDNSTHNRGVSEDPEPPEEQSPLGGATTSVISEWSNREFVCLQCAKESKNRGAYRRHARQHDSNANRRECAWPDCTYYSLNRTCVKRHYLAVHLRLRLYECKIDGCTKAYSGRSTLIRHMIQKHPGDEGQIERLEEPKVEIDESIYIKGYYGPPGEQSPIGDAPTPVESEDLSESVSITSDNISEGAPTDSEYTSRVRLPSISGFFEAALTDSESTSRVRLPSISGFFEAALTDSESTSRVRLPSISGFFEAALTDSESTSRVRLPSISGFFEAALTDSESTSRVRLPSISGVFEGAREGSEGAPRVQLPRLRDVLLEFFPFTREDKARRNRSPTV